MLLGSSFAFAITLTDIRAKQSLVFCFMLPMMIPPQVTALSWLQLFGPASPLLSSFGMAPPLGSSHPLYSANGIALLLGIQHAPLVFLALRTSLVALARCLVTEPEVVLLDEPLANLDRHLRASMEESFREFHRRTGATLVYVTHDQAEAMSLADRIAVMRDGRLVQWATPQTLYRQPCSEWVARFIGQGSVLRLPVVAPGRDVSGAELMALAMQSESVSGAPVLVRPEHVQVGDTGLAARVESCIFRGERYELWLRLGNGQRLFAYHREALLAGGEVRLGLQRGWALESDP